MASRSELEAQLREHWPRLRRFAYSLSRDAADADDLVQDVAMRAMASCDQWQVGSRFDSWIFRITRNLWIDTVRSRGRRDKHHAPAEAGELVGQDPTPGIEASLDLSTAMKAMQKLPDEQREVIALILIDGLGYREASEVLDLPIGTISSRLARGRTALLELLGE
ncbi:RNA polymerase sigma factor [Sphingomonas rhizophila]|uniref:RNA polymerase sigma factor n=1 Tax=Sphingomonas rhizophila TaxID=2071607 RepID=A0A7G9SA53_9SPHN|nr:RNA polymerase sigma factor [Sphingomonas rhizophila]QNN64728.1 RNA polymerase sigma factor [Sphingomonas rhizophila]